MKKRTGWNIKLFCIGRFDRFERDQNNSKAFTLTELMMVIAIVGVLAAILFTSVNKGLEMARTAKCTSNARQLIQGILMYATDNDGKIPYSRNPTVDSNGEVVNAGPYWEAVIDPYVEGSASDLLQCPYDASASVGFGWSYNALPYTAASGNERNRYLSTWLHPSKVMVFGANGELNGFRRRWIYSPIVFPNHWGEGKSGGVSTYYSGGSVFAFMDGHVEVRTIESISDDGDPRVRKFWGAEN